MQYMQYMILGQVYKHSRDTSPGRKNYMHWINNPIKRSVLPVYLDQGYYKEQTRGNRTHDKARTLGIIVFVPQAENIFIYFLHTNKKWRRIRLLRILIVA